MMKKKKIEGLDIDVYEENLNGFRVFIAPMKYVNGIYTTLSVNFGGDMEEFIPYGEKKMVKMPRGVAHFLEHQKFNTKDNQDIFSFFSERGTSCNANTRNDKTTYLFSGVDFFEENLNKLLDFVFEPYFTDESVNKEKGIIKEEIKMYLDDPYTKIAYKLYENLLKNHPLKDPVIGSCESVDKVTKEDLYKCYNTFYQPSNMYLIVTGNVSYEQVIDIVKNNMAKKEFLKPKEIVTFNYKEPNKVVKEIETLNLKVNTPKMAIGYKIDISKIKNLKPHEIKSYLSFIFDSKLGSTSDFLENIKSNKLIIDNFYISSISLKDHILYIIEADTEKPEILAEKVIEELKNTSITENELLRRKRVLMSYQILGSENIYQVNTKIMNNIASTNEVLYDAYNDIKKMNYKTLNYLINNISLDNKSILYVKDKS